MLLPVSDMRQHYNQGGLNENEAQVNPIKQFSLWFKQATESDIYEPNAMTLGTVSVERKPMTRVVLLKGFDEQGFVFYTNYESQKGQHLARMPWASLTFWWDRLARQVHIQGVVEKVSASESDEYFASRPRGSQLGLGFPSRARLSPAEKVWKKSWLS